MDIKKMNIAVIFDGALQDGGGFQQQLSTILQLRKNNKYNFIAFVFSVENKTLLESYEISTCLLSSGFFNKVFRYINRQEWFYNFSSRFKILTSFERKLVKAKIDLVYFLSPSTLAVDLLIHNYIITVWDLCHRDTPEFPEGSNYRKFEQREQLYNKSLKKAVAVLVDSKIGKNNVIQRYGVDEKRVYVAPFAPSVNVENNARVDVESKYNIQGEYIYYPAQFWSHKNHIYIIDAISILKSQGIEIRAIFSGTDRGNLSNILSYAKLKNIEELIQCIGFVPNEDLYSLYKNSLAMVMPSYFGPTNIPPLEAFAIGTPVIYSDIAGFREQVGDGALFCDLKTPESLVEHLLKLHNSKDFRTEMIQKGKLRLEELKKVNVVDILSEILDDFAVKLKCWKF